MFDSLSIAFVAVCAVLSVFVVKAFLVEDQVIKARRVVIGQLGTKLAALGFVKLPKLASYYSTGNYIKGVKFAEVEVEAFIENPETWVIAELSTTLTNMAKTDAGLAMLQSAVASVATPTPTSPAGTAASPVK